MPAGGRPRPRSGCRVRRAAAARLLTSTTRRIEVWTTPGLSTLAAQEAAKGTLRVGRVLAPPSTAAVAATPAGTTKGEQAVALAERFLGVPYLWAGADPI